MKRKSTFLRMFALLALLLPWTLQAQNAKVSEYDYEVTSAAYTSIASTGTAWTQADITAGYVDVTLPFAMYLGENQAAANSTVSVYADGHVVLNGLTGAEIAPLQYSAGYATTVTSIYYQQTASNEMTIEWRKVVANGNVLSFQLKLAADGTVKFCYGPMGMSSNIGVFVGIQADGYIFRVGGSSWDEITRYTSGTTTRALNGTNLPAYDVNTGIGTVYTFTQPACVKPTAITATATAWNAVEVGWTVAEAGTKYQVAYSTNADFDPDAATFPASQIVTVNDPTATSTEITGLNSETTYFFAVRKYCDATTASGWLYKTTGTTTPESCPSPALSNFSLSAAGVATWTLSSYPNIATVDIYYSTENVAPDAETAPSVSGIAAATAQYDLTTQNLASATTYYVWFRGHCTIDGGNNTAWFGSRSFTTPCSAQTLPYSEDFSSYSPTTTKYYTGPAIVPNCWEMYGNGTNTAATTGSTYFGSVNVNSGTSYGSMVANDNYLCLAAFYYTGTTSTYINYAAARGNERYAVMPQFTSSLSDLMISFNYKMSTTNSNCKLHLGYITNDISDFQVLATYNATTTTQTVSDKDLSTLAANAPTGARLAFKWVSEYSYTSVVYCGIDNIYVSTIPTCFRPTGLTVTDNTASTVSLSWTDPNGASAWQIEYGPSGFEHGTGTIVDATTTSATIENLGLGDWDFYVRAVCSATDQSDWSNPATQHLGYCLPAPTSHDNQGIGGVTFGTSLIVNDETATTATTRYQDHTNMIGDAFAGDDLTVSILYKTGYTYGTKIWVDWNHDLDFEDSGEQVFVGLSASSNPTTFNATFTIPAGAAVGDYTMRIGGTDNDAGPSTPCYTSTYGVFRDYTLRVTPVPSCFSPSNLAASNVTATSATLTWTERGLSTQWEVKYGPRGFNPDEAGTSVIVNTTPTLALSYLYMVKDYDAYVRAICDPEGPTDWSSVCEFKTLCPNGGTVSMGDADSYMQGLPVYNYYDYSISEQIYTSAELGGANTFTSISYYVNATGTDRNPVVIYLGETSKTSFDNSSDWIPASQLTQVYSGNLVTSVTGWQTVEFTVPFQYSGTNNLIVMFDNNDGDYSGQPTFGVINTDENQSLWNRRDNTDYDPNNLSGITSYSFTTVKNNFKFGATCDTGACAAPSVVINGSQSGDFAIAELTFTDNSGETTPTYGYKCVLSGVDPTSVTGITTTNSTATISNLAGNTQYDLYVYAVCGGTEGNMVRYTFTTPMVYACKPQANFATSNVTYTSATVTWEQLDPNQTPESWTVRFADHQIADMSAAAATEYTESTVTTPTLALTGLHNGNTYYIYTKATCNALDVSPDWTEFSFTTNTVMAPDAIAFSNVTNRTADMSWTDNNTPATNNYTVRYADHQIADIDNAAATEYTELTLTSTQYAFTMSNPLDPAAGYYVYVRANAGDEHSVWSVGTVNTLCPAPAEAAIGEETGTNQYIPLYTLYDNSLTQQIYTATELGGPNMFSTISYYVATPNTSDRTVDIYVGETDKNEFANGTDWVPYSQFTNVYSGTFVSSEAGWHTIELSTPITYSGNNNLVVMVNNHSSWQGTAYFNVISTDNNQAIYVYRDGTVYDATTPAAYSGTLLTVKNNFVFGGCDATVTCIPPKDVTAQVSTTNEVTLTWATRENLVPVPTTFEVRYDVAGTTADECANVITDITALNATFSNGLVKNTDYVAYVASKCGNNDYSPWQRVTFTTNPTCWDPSNLAAETALTTASSVTLTWNNNATVPASRWQIAYAEGYVTDPEAATNIVDATNNEGTEITGLTHSAIYTFYVRAVCDEAGEDVSNWVGPYYTVTGCAAWTADDLPLTEDFSINVSGMPWCWSKLPTTGTYPHSNNGYLWFYNNSTTDLYAVLPEVSVDVNTLDVAFDLYFDMEDNLIVGVMSDPADASTFTPVVTLNSEDYNYNEYNNVTAQLADYTGTGHYVAFKVAGTNSDAYIYVDNLTLKVREASHPLADNGETVALCDQYLIPTISDQTNTYSPNVNATYIVTPATNGKVLKLKGDYNLEYGYDFLDVYEGTDANATLVTTLTGKGNYEYMTSSYDWANKGGIKLVFRTDGDNAMPNLNGFHFLATCECPEMVPDVEELAETANGTYTWTAPNGDGNTYTHNVVLTSLTYGDPEETVDDLVNIYDYTQANVAGCDSINKQMTLTLHPTYSKTYDAEICQYETFSFYGQEYTATGTYTINLTSKDGADSIGILNLQVHQAPTAAIYYNGRAVTTVENFCDNADMALLARSNTTGATFVWDDNSTEANRVVNPHESNTYTVVATEPTYGCSSLTASVTVTTTPVPELSIAATNSVICRGESTTLTLTDANNTEATYTWSNGQTGNSITVTPTETTTYTATATTTTGACVATAEYTVTVNQLPVVTAEASVSTICSDSIITLTATEVEGYSYQWSTGAATATVTTVATATADYTVTVTDANGCVNEFTTATVTVRPSYERDVNMDVCYTQNPYTWGTQQLTADGSYDQMFTAANGCDSLIHLTFTFQQMSVFNTPREVCEGTVLTWGPETVTATENTTVSYILNAGETDPATGEILDCPAQYNLNLVVNHPAASSFDRTVCDSTTWNISGLTYYESGAYPYTLATTKGCDSVVTMNLTVNYHVYNEFTVEHACDSYTWNTETYTEPGDYVQSFAGAKCDSTRTLHLLVVDNTTYGTDDILFCGDTASWIAGNTGYTWIDGVTYTMSETEGNITHTLVGGNANGCDSIATLNLTLNPVAEVMNWANVSACDEYSIDTISCDGVRGTKYISESGDYWLRTPTPVAGRDVLTRIHLTINRSSYHTTVVSACVPYDWNVVVGQDPETGDDINYLVGTYNESGNVSFQMPDQYSANGCNRIEVLRLTALMPTEETTMATICQNGSWTSPDNNVTYNGADLQLGENTKTWSRTTNEAGCNLDKKVVLTVNPVYNATAELTFCESEFTNNQLSVVNDLNADDDAVVLTIPVTLDEQPYTNTLTANWTTQSGCDSIVTITYTVNPTTYESVDFATCYKYTWDLNGETYEESGAYTYTNEGANSYHCDNVVTLNLTINDSVVENVTEYHCSDYEYEGVTYRTTETFREVLEPTAEGCEHVRYVTHTIIPTQMTDLYVVTNMPYTWQNGVTYTESVDPVYFETTTLAYAATNGSNTVTTCDSILVLHLTIVDDTAEFCENELPYNYTAMGITLDGSTSSRDTWTNVPDLDQMQNTNYYFFGTDATGQWTQWRTRFLAGEHDGMLTVNGTEFANRESEYITVDLVVNGETKATKTLHNLPSLSWIDVFFDTPVRINDNDVVDFVYTAESQYAVYTVANDNGISHPNNYQIRYSPDSEWGSVGENNGLYFNFNMWYNFGIDDGYYYIRNTEDHHDTILYYVVNRNKTENIAMTACDSYTWTDGTGLTYTESGEYTYQTTTVNGCDSTVTLNLTINVNSSETLDAVTACNSYDWTYQGNAAGTYTESGTYTHNFIDANGCASVATLPLTINNSVNETLEAVTACDSYEWNYNDVTVGTFTTSGDQVYNFTDANGCDGTVTLPLTINASSERDETIVVNEASTYRNGNYYPASDTPYTFDEIGTNAAGCPETVHITLIVHQGATEDVEVNACGEYTWETANNGNGHTYQWISNTERQQNSALYKDITDPANPIYIHAGENPQFATFNPDGTVNTTYVLWLNLSEAGYETVDLGTILLSQQSSLTVNGGADSLDAQTIDLSEYIAAKQNATLNVQVRHNSPSNWYCGNIVTYTANLVWNYDTVQATICDATTYEWTEAGETFAVSTANDFENGGNMLTHIFNAGTANEQVTTMKVSVTTRTTSDPQVVSNCFTYTWAAGDGQTYTTSGTYYWNDDANCTLETLDLTIFDNSSYTLPAVTACDSYTWTYNTVEVGTYTTSGDCTFDITDANGCAATVTLPLTINKNHGHSSVATACDSYTWNANDGNTYVLDATQEKVVEYTDANSCVGYDTLTLTINNSNNYTDVQTACGSFEWIVNGVTVGTYTESNNTATYTIANGNVAGCDSIVTLDLTVYNPRTFSRDQYAYGNGITINGQFYEAPTTGVATYNVVLDTVDPEANDCPTVVNVTLYVSQYEYFYTNYVACGSYTWPVNNHTYRGLTDEEAAANPTAIYFDETDNVAVTSNPMSTEGNRIDVLNLTINKPSVTNITRTVLMSQLEAGYTLTLEGNVEDFSAEYAAHQNATVTRSYSLGAHATCDSIVNYTINLVWNYDTVNATVCDVTSYEWTAAEETFAVTTGDNLKTHVFNAGTETEQVTTMKVTVLARTEDPQAPVTVCDTYTWHETEYTASANLEYNNDEACTHETLVLTINTNAGSEETVAECFTYTWNVPTYELDATTDNYVAAADISNTYTEGGVKTVTFIDANGCQGTATLNLTIYADQSETLAAVTACDSYEWTYNNVVVNTYTEGGDKTYNWTDANGCAATATLPLTINNSASVDVEFWEGEGSYRYTGIYTTAPAQMLSASSTPYNFVETVAGATADGCDSIYNITLHVGNYYYATETYRSCNSFTWERNNHTYTRLTDEQAAANPTALYFDETDNAVVLYNPTVNVPNEGTYDSLFMLQLTLDAIWDSVATIDFPVSEGTLTWKGKNYDFSLADNDAGREFTGLSIIDTIHFAAATFCDSMYRVTINVYNNYREVETADICATTTEYTWRGQTISTVTTDFDNEHTYYIYDAINANDSVQYITLTQHPVTYATERRTACDSYTWYVGNDSVGTYTTSTTNETYTAQDEFGCDHIVTLTLTINHSSSNFIETAACDTYTWTANNAAQTEIGTYTATPNDTLRYDYVSDEGCPSTDVLVLTVNHNTSTEYTVDACDSYTWTAEEGGDGRVLTATGVETYDYTTAEGCPSTNTLNLTIRNNSNQTINKVVCDSYIWTAADGGDGLEYTADGTYTYEYTADNGCLSVNTLNLTVNTNAGLVETPVVICDSYTWNVPTYVLNTATNLYELGDAISNTYTESGEKTVTFTDANGCEGTATLDLTINVNEGSVEDVAECQNYTWAVNGITYTESGTYTAPVTDDNGCVGTATLNLTIGTMRTFVNQAVTNCGPYTWIVNDSVLGTFEQSVELSANLPNSITGCDSVVMLALTVNPLNVTEETICSNGSYLWTVNNTTYTEAGTYDEVESDGNGNCISAERLVLTVNPVKETALTDQICLGNDYTANDFNIAAADIAAAGEYTFTRTLTSAQNCDSVVTLTLTVGDILTNAIEATACDSYTWTAGDNNEYTFTTSGTYTSEAYANAMGCTTVDELTLTINQNSSTAYTETVCDGYMWNGTQYTESGDYTYEYTDTNNCVSVDTLHLTINNSVINNIEKTACDSYTWENGDGETYTTSGVYSYSYTTTDGCNGTDYLVLTINSNSNTEYTETVCDSYVWNGTEYNESGDYEYEYEAANGCPSKDILHLTVNNSTTSEETAENCNFYNWHGETYTTSGDYTYVSTNDAGCQHTATLHLTINTPVTVTIDTTVCDVFAWNGINYLHSDVITHSFTAANGCDSTEIINLTVNNPVSTTLTETACDSYIWPVTGLTYTESDVYMAEFVAANGCDSIIYLHLTVNHNSNSSETVTACDSYTWNGQTYTTSGTQTYAYNSIEGCPSVDTLYLTINNSTVSEETAAACNSYTWNGNVYSQSGDYTNVTTNNAGCADTAILHLTINTPVTTNITETTCNSYTWNGATYTTSGIYTNTFTAANGCDSIVNLMLTISAPVTSTVNATACDSYTWNGTAYTTSGTYTYNGTAANGCDSIVTLNLVINSSKTNAISATACNSYTWNGATYTTTGSYTQTFTTTAGCDSVVTLALAISPAYQTEINQSSCSSYTWNGNTYTTSGNYTHTYTAANGCDSIVTLHLTVTPTINMTVTATACDSYTWNGTVYTTSGNYTHTYTAAAGCDSVVTLALTINNSATGTATATACDSYTWNGTDYTTSGNYTHTYTAANGCDSVVTLTLTVNNSVAVNTAQTVCDSYTWNGMMYVASGVYTQSFNAANGCDSTVTLTLTVNNSYHSTDVVEECDSYIWIDGNNYTTSTTTPTYTYTAANGCDSVITLNLTINYSVEIYDSITILSTSLPFNYRGNVIEDAGDYFFNGTTVSGCDSSVYLHVDVQTVGIDVVNSLDDITIYPNPTRGRVTVTADEVVKIEVMDIVGRRVATFENTNTFDISDLGEGAYTLRITLPNGTTVRKVVKK